MTRTPRQLICQLGPSSSELLTLVDPLVGGELVTSEADLDGVDEEGAGEPADGLGPGGGDCSSGLFEKQ